MALGEGERRAAALYLRVSSEEQHLGNQRPDLLRLARQRGLEIVSVYEEKVSAGAAKRPQLERLMLAAHRAEFDHVLVWALDRLGRSLVGNLDALLTLDQLGVRVISYQESWLDNIGPTRGLLVAILSWVAEHERQRIGERTRAGLERARKKGTRLGRPRVHINVDCARQLLSQGFSYRQAARKLGVGASTLHRAIQEADLLSRSTVNDAPCSEMDRTPDSSQGPEIT